MGPYQGQPRAIAALALIASGAQGNGGGCPMTIENRRQLENTGIKLRELEQLYVKTQQGSASSEHVRELTLRSLKRRINQFKEEVTRFETRAS
jgi:hypothetical protein